MRLKPDYLEVHNTAHERPLDAPIGEGKCRICGNDSGNRIHEASEMFFGMRDPFKYVECVACQTLQIQSLPDLHKYYPHDYYSFQQPDDVPTQTTGFAKPSLCELINYLVPPKENASK